MKRKYIRKKTKEKLRLAIKLLLTKWYIYSYNELYRIWLYYREIQYYLLPLVNIVKKTNTYDLWKKRFKLTLKKDVKKILRQPLYETIVYNDREVVDLIKILFI